MKFLLLLNFLLEINSWAFSTEPASHTAASINPSIYNLVNVETRNLLAAEREEICTVQFFSKDARTSPYYKDRLNPLIKIRKVEIRTLNNKKYFFKVSISPLKNNPAGTVKLSIDNNYTKQESAHSIVPVSYFDFLIIPVIKPLASEDFKLSIEIFEDGADGQFREQRVYDIQLIKKQSRRGFRL